ncbi:glycosyltransferase family 39 protein [candidate division KSB1 bacterium]|nr:glycosyltransferase family 39 protein [candidate division KSB1 bacterium]
MFKTTQTNNLILFSLLILAIGIRIIYLEGDAPAGDISNSATFYADEGSYLLNSINLIRTGTPFQEDEVNIIVSTPVASFFYYLFFKLFGISYFTARLATILLSGFSLLIIYFITKKDAPKYYFLILLLGALNFFFIIYNRFAIFDNMLTTFLLLTSFCLFTFQQKQKSIWLILSALTFWMAFFVKGTGLFFLPVIVLFLYFETPSKIQFIKNISIFSLASLVILLLTYLFWIQPNKEHWQLYQSIVVLNRISLNPVDLLYNFSRNIFNLKLFQFMPVAYTIFLFYCGALFTNIVTKKKTSALERFFFIWAISCFLFFSLNGYSPPRYWITLLPPIIILNGIFFQKLFHSKFELSSKYFPTLIIFISILCVAQIAHGFYRIFSLHHNFISCYLPLISIVIIIFFVLMKKGFFSQKPIGYIFITLIMVIQLFQITNHYFNIKFSFIFSIRNVVKIIHQQESENPVILGDLATSIIFETNVKAVSLTPINKVESKIIKNKPCFLLLQDNQKLEILKEAFPSYFKNVILLKKYKIFENYYHRDFSYFYYIQSNNCPDTFPN